MSGLIGSQVIPKKKIVIFKIQKFKRVTLSFNEVLVLPCT